MNFCKDCRHFSTKYGRDTCTKPHVLETDVNLISGDIHVVSNLWLADCHHQRKSGPVVAFLFGTCGRQGRWFELRTKNGEVAS